MYIATVIVSIILSQLNPTPVYADVTQYTAIETCGDVCIMANGKEPSENDVACPREVPLNSLVFIEDIGWKICGDRTALWVDGRYDVFAGYTEQDYTNAINFGKQNKKVYVYKNNNL